MEKIAFRFALSCLGELAQLGPDAPASSKDFLRHILTNCLLYLDARQRLHLAHVSGQLQVETGSWVFPEPKAAKPDK